MRWLLMMVLALSLSATPLHHAVTALDYAKIDALLQEGADINATDGNGDTPLHIASRIGRLAVVKKLLAYAPDLHAKNRNGDTPLAVAISKNHIKSVQLLVKAHNASDRVTVYTGLHKAVADNDFYAVRRFLYQGENPDVADKEGVTPLHLAARLGKMQFIEMLIEYGADVYRRDKNGRDALYYARFGNHPEVVKKIMQERKKGGKREF